MKHYDTYFKIFNKIKDDKIFIYASHASFYILISAIPFIMLSFSLINIFLSLDETNIFNTFLSFFPTTIKSTAKDVFQEVYVKASTGFISFSIISILWSSSRGITAAKRGLRQIYNLAPVSFFKDILYSILQIFFMILVVFCLIIFTIIPSIIPSYTLVSLLGFLFFSLLFASMYYLFTERKITFKSHIPGSIAASLSWILFIRIFSIYIKHFSNYSRIYGSLTTVLIIALWIYFSTVIFFLGAEINSAVTLKIFSKNGNKKELF